MTIRHLKTFIAVCETGSMTKAGEQLHVAQPSVSLCITEMEKYYGVVLFERINQRLILTEVGRLLLEKAKEAVSEFDEFESVAGRTQSDPTVRIGATLSVGKVFIPSLLTAIKASRPSLQPFVRICRLSLIEEVILDGSIDFAVVEGSVSSPLLIREKLGSDRLAVVCAASSTLPAEITVAGLTELPLFLREEGSASRKLLDAVLSARGLTVHPVMLSSSNSAIIAAVSAGHGVAVLPIELAKTYIENGTLREIRTDERFGREINLIYHKNKRFTKAQETARGIAAEAGKSMFGN